MSARDALPAPPRWRAPLALLLALLIQGAWWTLMQWAREGPQARPEAALTAPLLWLAPRARPDTSSPARAPVPTLRGQGREATRKPPGELDVTPQQATAPAVDSTAATAPPGTSAAPPARLILSLPPQRAASQSESLLSRMLNDPRSNRERRDMGWAVADAAGTLPSTVQESTDGTGARLIRQGSKCLRVRESRAKVLSPMDEQFRNAPAMVGHCVND